MAAEDPWTLLESLGAILRGHFRLSSGRHSDLYVQKARILERPEATMELARRIGSGYGRIDVVASPAVGAVPLGFAVALAAGARSIFAEREDGVLRLRRGFRVAPGERTLVVEDVITTGASAREVLRLVESSGGEPLGVACLVDRSTTPLGFPFRALVRVEAASWPPEDCPLCREAAPLDAPGSRDL